MLTILRVGSLVVNNGNSFANKLRGTNRLHLMHMRHIAQLSVGHWGSPSIQLRADTLLGAIEAKLVQPSSSLCLFFLSLAKLGLLLLREEGRVGSWALLVSLS